MIVAVRIVHEMQVTVHQVVVVVEVRDELVAAGVVVDVRRLAREGGVWVGARDGVGIGHPDFVVVNMAFVGIVHMSIVQVVYVVLVRNGGVTAPHSVRMWMMSLMNFVSAFVFL